MTSYEIEVRPAALRALRRIDKPHRLRIEDAIDGLATDPRPHGTKALQGHRGRLRIRVGDYRIVYEVQDEQLVVVVVTLGHRRDIYDRL